MFIPIDNANSLMHVYSDAKYERDPCTFYLLFDICHRFHTGVAKT